MGGWVRLAQHTATHRARVLQLLSKPCDLFLELTKHGILSIPQTNSKRWHHACKHSQ